MPTPIPVPAMINPPEIPFISPVKIPEGPFSFDSIMGAAIMVATPPIIPFETDFKPEESPEKKCFGLRVEKREDSVPIKLN
jgi:hypothetical protein